MHQPCLHLASGSTRQGSHSQRASSPERHPGGVREDPAPGQDTITLCTFVADLTSGEAALLGRRTEAVAIPLADLA